MDWSLDLSLSLSLCPFNTSQHSVLERERERVWSGSWCKKKQAEFASTEILVLLVLIFKSSGSYTV